jgi:hypothetical protein
MESARPLRDVFAGLAGHTAGPEDVDQGALDPQAMLAEHEGLPDDLLMTAIGSYAGTAPAEVAEHLAPIVALTSDPAELGDSGDPGPGLAGMDALDGLHLLASAPVGEWAGEVALEPDLAATDDGGWADPEPDLAGQFADFDGGLSTEDFTDDVDHSAADFHAGAFDPGSLDANGLHADGLHADVLHADGLDAGGLSNADSLDQGHHIASSGLGGGEEDALGDALDEPTTDEAADHTPAIADFLTEPDAHADADTDTGADIDDDADTGVDTHVPLATDEIDTAFDSLPDFQPLDDEPGSESDYHSDHTSHDHFDIADDDFAGLDGPDDLDAHDG